jgi:hypothetical protein
MSTDRAPTFPSVMPGSLGGLQRVRLIVVVIANSRAAASDPAKTFCSQVNITPARALMP